MPTFRYRIHADTIRSRLPPTESGAPLVVETANRGTIEVHVQQFDGAPVQSITITQSGFTTKDKAWAAAARTTEALAIAGVVAEVPVRLNDHAESQFAPDLNMPNAQGTQVIDEASGPTTFFRVHAQGYVGVYIDRFQSALSDALVTVGERELSAEDRLAAEVFMSMSFEATTQARFLTLVTVLEILANKNTPRSEAVIEFVEAAIRRLDEETLELDGASRDSLRVGLGKLKYESITRSVRNLGISIAGVPLELPEDQTVDSILVASYKVRSQLTHEGFAGENLSRLYGPLYLMTHAILTQRISP